jgi:hypothetical protein
MKRLPIAVLVCARGVDPVDLKSSRGSAAASRNRVSFVIASSLSALIYYC